MYAVRNATSLLLVTTFLGGVYAVRSRAHHALFMFGYFSAIYLAMRLLREIAFLKGRGTRYKFPCLVVIGDRSA